MKVLIADDHALFRNSLRTLLEAHRVEVVGEAADGRRAIDLARELRPDVVLMDLAMPGMDGLDATRAITEQVPDASVIVVTASDDDQDLLEALRSGAIGFVSKTLEADNFMRTLEMAAKGIPVLPPGVVRRVLDEATHGRQRNDPDALTERESDVLRLMAGGTTSNRDLARELGVSENTVKFHVRNILDKLHLNSRAQAVGFALRNRLVRPVEVPAEDETEDPFKARDPWLGQGSTL